MNLNNNVLILGGIIIDQCVMVEHNPQRGDDVLIYDSFFRVGGCAVNVATTLKNLEQMPYIVSSVGDDVWGRKINDYLNQKGFAKDAIQVLENSNTGYCISIVESQGERTFLTYKGCESRFDIDMVSNELGNRISHVYLTGYYLLNSHYSKEILGLIKRIKNNGATILFDPGPLVANIEDDILLSIIKLADILIPNMSELEKMKKKLDLGDDAISWFLECGVKFIAEKMGDYGVQVWTDKHNYHIPSYKVVSKDTSGAGDSFAGGLLFGLIQKYDIEKSVKIASACGALTTTILGPHGEFVLEDVLAIMQREGD